VLLHGLAGVAGVSVQMVGHGVSSVEQAGRLLSV
jgi:hypothetical protein